MRTCQFEAGAEACFHGVPRDGNPWLKTDCTEQIRKWFDGWDSCDHEIMTGVPTETVVNVPRVTFVYEPEYGNPVG